MIKGADHNRKDGEGAVVK